MVLAVYIPTITHNVLIKVLSEIVHLAFKLKV